MKSRLSTSPQNGSRPSVSRHEEILRTFVCVVCQSTDRVTLHHCHGGSMKEHGWHVGMGQKQNPFLQIPLHPRYHVGKFGIDSGYGVESWERDFGTQWEHLTNVNAALPYDIFDMAREWEDKHRS